ncbi:MAG: GntR family transcriptional regulator, partial [Rhizobacter sp.]|nr:GntR family transcriptional regulator [Rhizobacter sp.]
MPLKPLERTTLWDQAYAALREALLEGRFAPGDRVVLRDVARELGISSTPVRDAVNRLVAERVLERGFGGQGGGAVVPRIDVPHFQELLTIRCDLEGRAASCAALAAKPADIKRLGTVLDEMQKLIAARKLDRYLSVHRHFHFELYGLSGMSVLSELIENLWLRCGPVLTYVIPTYVTLLKGTDLHRAAVAGLKSRDPEAASTAIRRDIEEAGRYLIGLADRDGWITNVAHTSPP